jgi:hypothetical protein
MSPKLRRTRHDDEAALDVTQVTVFEWLSQEDKNGTLAPFTGDDVVDDVVDDDVDDDDGDDDDVDHDEDEEDEIIIIR